MIDALIGVSVPNLSGGYSAMMPNHHITKPVLIGEIQDDGQFNIVSQTPGLVVAQEWSPYVADTKDLIGDWRAPLHCGAFNVKTGKCGAAAARRPDGLICHRCGGGRLLPAAPVRSAWKAPDAASARAAAHRRAGADAASLARAQTTPTTRSPRSPRGTSTRSATASKLLAASGDPQRAADHRRRCRPARCTSRADHALFIKTDDGSFIDAATGKPAPDVMAERR